MLDLILTSFYVVLVKNVLNIIFELFLMILTKCGILYYTLEITRNSNLLENIKYGFYTVITADNTPCGFILGKGYIGYILKGREYHDGEITDKLFIYLFCKEKKFNELDKNPKRQLDNNIIYRDNITEKIRNIPMKTIIPHKDQKRIMNQIIDYYENNSTCVVYISGDPGIGKSKIGYLLAQHYKSVLACFDTSSTRTDQIRLLPYYSKYFTNDHPLIYLCDEVDTYMMVDKKDDESHNKKNTHITKQKWNQLLDTIDNGFYPFMIFIMTSNIKMEDLGEQTDPSMFRKGRVNLNFHM